MNDINKSVLYGIIAITVATSVVGWVEPYIKEAFIGWPHRTYFLGEWYRLLTSGLIHANMLHLFLNIYTLYSFSRILLPLLQRSGWWGWHGILFVVLYFGSILAANLVAVYQHRENPDYRHLGASAAVTAVIMATILYTPHIRIHMFFLPVPVSGKLYLPIYLLYSYFMARNSTSNIGHMAHFIGGIYGILFVLCVDWRKILYFFKQYMR